MSTPKLVYRCQAACDHIAKGLPDEYIPAPYGSDNMCRQCVITGYACHSLQDILPELGIGIMQ